MCFSACLRDHERRIHVQQCRLNLWYDNEKGTWEYESHSAYSRRVWYQLWLWLGAAFPWRALVECHRIMQPKWVHLMVSLITCCKTPLPNIFDYDIQLSIVIIHVLGRCSCSFERLNCMGYWRPWNWGFGGSNLSDIESSKWILKLTIRRKRTQPWGTYFNYNCHCLYQSNLSTKELIDIWLMIVFWARS